MPGMQKRVALPRLGQIYDRQGILIGKIIDNRIYDLNGSLWGSVVQERIYDSHGSRLGEVIAGHLFDARRQQVGRVNSQGQIFDPQGQQVGVIALAQRNVELAGGAGLLMLLPLPARHPLNSIRA